MLSHIIHLCVRRRVMVLLLVLAVSAYGVSAYLHTPVEAFPDVTNLQVTVLTQMPGSAPEEVERQITIPLERVLNGTPGMLQLRSESHFGLSMVSLIFEDEADVFRSRALVSERVSTADLPDGVVAKLAPDATPLGKVYQYRIVSDRHSANALRSEQDWTVVPLLKQVPGVAEVVSFGGFRKEFHLQADPARLIAHGLTLSDVTDALKASNQNVGGGILSLGEQGLAIRGIGYLRRATELLDVVLRTQGGVPVTVRDVAQLVQSYTPRLGSIGYEERADVTEGYVLLRRGENPSVVLSGIEEKIQSLNSGRLPAGMSIVPFYDRTSLVRHTLSTVYHNLAFGAVLVVSVVWLFLRTLRGSVVVAAVIPVALLGAFIGLRFLRLPANLISLGAIDFGILVDAAVVLVESVLHAMGTAANAKDLHRQHPGDRLSIITHAAVRVGRPALFAMAIITAALMPIFTLERIEGRIFRPLAMTYAFALLGALLLAFTLVPALCALLIRPKDVAHGDARWLHWLRTRHERGLAALLHRQWLVGIGLVCLLGLGGAAVSRLGSEFLPELDEGDLLIFAEMPPSISLEQGADTLHAMRQRITPFPEVLSVLTEQGRPEDGTDNESLNLGKLLVRLRPRDSWRSGWDRDRLVQTLRERLSEIPGVRYNFSQPIRDAVEESVSGARGKVVLKVVGEDLDLMRTALKQAMPLLKAIPGVVDLDLYRDATVPQIHIALDRAALARAGIRVADALDLVETATGGQVVTSLWEGERPVDVRVRLPAPERSNLAALGAILIPAADGARIPLRDLAAIRLLSGRASILREENRRFAALKFNVEGRDMGSVVADAQAVIAKQLQPPPGHDFVWTGEFENQQRAMKRLSVVVPISFVIVFALLYLALRSVRGALSILLLTPFAMTGGALGLLFSGMSLSVSAAVGFITLLGQVCLASLLVLSAIDDRLDAATTPWRAMIEGTSDRLRPVLLTALLAMLGLLPMALSHEIGSETQRPFAVVIIGGLFTALLVTLLALPVLYGRILRVQVDPTTHSPKDVEVAS